MTSSSANTTAPDTSYTPLGIWVANWSDVVPWLNTTILNVISPNSLKDLEALLTYRAVIQDFDALIKIYANAYQGGLLINEIDFSDIANSFLHAQAGLIDGYNVIQNSMTKGDLGSSAASVQNLISQAFISLSDNAKAIYRTWIANPFLRNCELGLAITVAFGAGQYSLSFDCLQPLPVQNTSSSLQQDGASLASEYQTSYLMKPTQFNPNETPPNLVSFANFMKCWPIILPLGGNTQISLFGPPVQGFNQDPERVGILAGIGYGGFGIQSVHALFVNQGSSLPFTANTSRNALQAQSDNCGLITAYPVPYAIARGIIWKGTSLSRNLGSFDLLSNSLDEISNRFSSAPLFTTSTTDWSVDDTDPVISCSQLSAQYIGLVDRPKDRDIFNTIN